MSISRTHAFETHQPVDLYVEIGSGALHVSAEPVMETTIEVTGRDAADVRVEQSGNAITVITPRQRGFFSGDSSVDVRVTLPTESMLSAKAGSADVTAEGTFSLAHVRSGSGGVALDILLGDSLVETGSGDVVVQQAHRELRIKSGSGDIRVVRAGGRFVVSTGSGAVTVDDNEGGVAAKTGSGDVSIRAARADVSFSTGSGHLEVGTAYRGRLSVKGASGGVRVGVPRGLPVWTDISTLSGEIRSDLDSAGEPAKGQDHLEVRATTGSGDVVLVHV